MITAARSEPDPATRTAGPLAGVRVVEIGRYIAAPFAARTLADLGAEVIKVEDPDGGDPMRHWEAGARPYSPQFAAYNRGKQGVTIDLRDPALRADLVSGGLDLLIHLAALPSGASEGEPGMAKAVNLDAAIALFTEAAAARPGVRVVHASSIAALGPPQGPVVTDDAPLRPTLTYGALKVMLETWLTDMTRRGDVRGLSLRLPGLVARPLDGRRAHAGWEDAAVPPQKLGAYLREFETLLDGHGLTGVPYGHFGDGCVHVRIDFPLDRPDGSGVFRAFLLDAAKLVASHGGSMSGEHGDGRARGELLPFMYSRDALDAFAATKAVFDPDDLLNPGVIVRPRPFDADLRAAAAPPLRRSLAFAYAEDGGDFSAAVHRCTGVGKCRADNTGTGGVMCPSYLATGDEKDSTRGRARVLQEMVNGGLVGGGWQAPEVREALDLCLSCKGCSTDCPTGVDMATYKAEALHQAYRRRPRPASHYALGWLPRWAALASRAPRTANAMLRSPLAGAGKRLAGVDSRRDLPAFASTTFRRWFAAHRPAAGDPVVLWVDTFTDHFTPEVGIAAVRVLEDAGFSVRIPQRKLCCGLTWISTGQLDAARRILRRSVTALAPEAERGTPIVGLEPSCTAVFRSDAAHLLPDDPRQAAVAAATRTLAEVLTGRGAHLPDLTGVRVLAQPHCHQHAVMGWKTDRALLEEAGATVRAVGGCCGLAGNFGAERGHYEVSVAVAENALLPAVRAADEATVLLADGFSCRTQLDQLAGQRGLHLAELLARHRR